MKRVIYASRIFFSQITKDMMLFAAALAPILAGLAFHFGIPFLETIIKRYTGMENSLHPYYGIFDGLLILLSTIMYCFIGAMCVLEEFDEGTARYLCVTPLEKKGYLASRIGIPAVLAFVVSYVTACIFTLEKYRLPILLLLCVIAMLQGIAISLMVISISHNKLEGMALTKLSGVFLLGLLVPYFIAKGSRWFGAIFPGFWMSILVQEENIFHGCVGIVVSILWITAFFLKFRKKI